jgi:hypothetical protein
VRKLTDAQREMLEQDWQTVPKWRLDEANERADEAQGVAVALAQAIRDMAWDEEGLRCEVDILRDKHPWLPPAKCHTKPGYKCQDRHCECKLVAK